MKLQRWEPDFDVRFSKADYDEDNQYWCKSDDVAELEVSRGELLRALKNLYYMVQGECPSLLDEDSGGSGYLDIEISDAIAKAEGTKQ